MRLLGFFVICLNIARPGTSCWEEGQPFFFYHCFTRFRIISLCRMMQRFRFKRPFPFHTTASLSKGVCLLSSFGGFPAWLCLLREIMHSCEGGCDAHEVKVCYDLPELTNNYSDRKTFTLFPAICHNKVSRSHIYSIIWLHPNIQG